MDNLLLLGVDLDAVLIDAMMALIALLIGFFAALWYARHTSGIPEELGEELQNLRLQEEQANEAERADMAAQQLRDLATNVASDVGAHHVLVTEVSNNLGAMDSSDPHSGEAVTQAIAQILEANGKLQNRLQEAEQKIQAQAEEIRSQQSEALTDALTKLSNRRAFDAELDKNINAFQQHQRPFSLILFDVDHFKEFNDTYGHQAGDEVLRSVGKTLKQVVKANDIPCRYGGEEFALIMPNTKLDAAKVAAERVRKAIGAMTTKFEDQVLQVTASVGVAQIAPGESQSMVIRRSDDCVYAAKNEGRNCTRWHDGKECLAIDASSKNEGPSETEEAVKPTPKPSIQLSDLPNGGAFQKEVARRIAESHRFGIRLSVMFLRVSGYPELEKEFGSAVGQLILESVAQFIQSTLRQMDLLAKLEQGDFAVMLPGSSEQEARLVGSRVETAVSNCTIPLKGKQVKLKLQHGIATIRPDDSAKSIIKRAEFTSEELESELAEAK